MDCYSCRSEATTALVFDKDVGLVPRRVRDAPEPEADQTRLGHRDRLRRHDALAAARAMLDVGSETNRQPVEGRLRLHKHDRRNNVQIKK